MGDITSFLILLVTTLMMFGVPIVLLDMNSKVDKQVIDNALGFWAFDILFNQYLLALGEFNIDNFAD